MSRLDREKYIRTVRTASRDRRFKPAYDRLITLHRTIFTSGIHERDHFLPWHRWYVLQYENLLRRIDCTVTVPYWDWSVVSQTPWRGGTSDLWFRGNSGFGGNGQRSSSQCVTNGPFRRGAWNVVPSAGRGCLRRQFIGNPPDTVAVAGVLRIRASDFDSFEISLRINLHDTVHCLIGGHMCSFNSAVSPEFILHHGFIDKIWADWQRQSNAHMNAHFRSVADNMPGTWQIHARAVINNFMLPGGVRIQYQASPSPQLRSVHRRLGEMSHSAMSRIPRGPFSVLSEKAIKLFNVSKAEVEKAKRLGLRLLPLSRTLVVPGITNSMETSLGFRVASLKIG
ncbi:hypothetical protein OS493_028347 [Desmophyllum pertusum]|uniref:Tyrosinase copper-binding domain-containing protein n=1 Tax=Desmophyllum pertusum TaxID=174260 RepID=A0A9X0CDF4_9CNID|nr:hypothetical protein OS493_028347 [Desmophyllum pertusum]